MMDIQEIIDIKYEEIEGLKQNLSEDHHMNPEQEDELEELIAQSIKFGELCAQRDAKAQAVPYKSCSIKSHEIIINETKNELIDGYDIAKEDEYLLESLVYRGVCMGKAQAVPEGFVLVEKKKFEQMQEFEDLYRRAIFNSKKSIHEVNWSHVSNLGVSSTRAKAMCKRFNIDPEATFRKTQEPAND